MGFLSWLFGSEDDSDDATERRANKLAGEAADAWERYIKDNDKTALQEYKAKQAEMNKVLGK